MTAKPGWHVNRDVPVALIVTVVLAVAGQTTAGTWWLANQAARLDQVERKLEAAAPQAERLIRLEEKVTAIQQGLADIKALIVSGRDTMLPVKPRRR